MNKVTIAIFIVGFYLGAQYAKKEILGPFAEYF